MHTRQAMDGRVFVVFLVSILIAEMRQRVKGYRDSGKLTIDLVRKTLDKVSVSYVRRDGKRKHAVFRSYRQANIASIFVVEGQTC